MKCFFQNGEQLIRRIFLDLVNCVETASFQGRLQLRKQKKVRWSQIWRLGWLGYKGRFVFRQKIAHKEGRVSWCIVVVQHPTLVRPQLRPLPTYGFPQTLQNCYVELLVYCLTTWNEFVVDYTLPVKENQQHHLHVGSTHSSFTSVGAILAPPIVTTETWFRRHSHKPRFRRLLRWFSRSSHRR